MRIPKGTIHGLGFKDVDNWMGSSIKKIENSGKTHVIKYKLLC